ncbi:hypothetical protein F2Q69_00013107 [Brassica cretica]|uniref:Uncharacterized protein n=1 Tax=Brassica cretica TaxID=69181 RepID=A0A8S9QLS8_BRACR|nr:hypothetical protein F2Q69_00013107 [Brassica cretica]
MLCCLTEQEEMVFFWNCQLWEEGRLLDALLIPWVQETRPSEEGPTQKPVGTTGSEHAENYEAEDSESPSSLSPIDSLTLECRRESELRKLSSLKSWYEKTCPFPLSSSFVILVKRIEYSALFSSMPC